MIIVDPYLTSYGKTLNKEKPKKDIMKYLITTDVLDLSYGYRTGNEVQLVFITGRNNDEKDILPFVYPIIVTDVRNKTIIAVDLRRFTKDVDSEILADRIKDTTNAELYILLAMVMSDFLMEDYTVYRKLFNSIAASYSVVTTHIISAHTPLSVVEKVHVEVAAAYYANLLLTPGKKYLDYKDAIMARISNIKFSVPADKRLIRNVVDNIKLEDELTIYGLIDVCKQLISEDKRDLIDNKVYISILSGMWFGTSALDLLTAGQECMPLWISIIYTTLSSMVYAKSKLTSVLDKQAKAIDAKTYVNTISLYLKDKGVVNV